MCILAGSVALVLEKLLVDINSTAKIATTSAASQAATPQSTMRAFPSDAQTVDGLFAKLHRETTILGCSPTHASFEGILSQQNGSLPEIVHGEEALKHHARFAHHFYALPQLDADRGGVAIFENAFVTGGVPMVYNGEFVYYPMSCGMTPKLGLPEAAAPTKIIELETAVLIAQFWGEAYYHSMIECLPRLAYVLDYLNNPVWNATILIQGQSLLTQGRPEQVWRPLLFPESGNATRWHAYMPNHRYFVRRLLVPTGSKCGNSQAGPLNTLRAHMAKNRAQYGPLMLAAAGPKTAALAATANDERDNKPVILVQQRSRRGLVNHAELVRALRNQCEDGKCVVLVNSDGQTMPEYAELHYRAHLIVGPHGAGLANLIFTDPRKLAGVVELHSTRGNWNGTMHNGCHRQTATALQVPHIHWVIAQDNSRFGQAFSVNVTHVTQLLHKAGLLF